MSNPNRARPPLLPGDPPDDEILLSNFMVFHDVVRGDQYDLWIGDEAWELDYYLHENPEQKRAAYAWLTDFVGWLPMGDGGEHEVSSRRRLQRRDDRAHRAFSAGPRPRDLRRQSRRRRLRLFGPDLPLIRDWTEEHFAFAAT